MLDSAERVTQRSKIQELLTAALRAMWAVDRQSVVDAVYLCSGTINDPWMGEETGVGEEILLLAAAAVIPNAPAGPDVIALLRQAVLVQGDLGIAVAAAVFPSPFDTHAVGARGSVDDELSVSLLRAALGDIARYGGKNSRERKVQKIASLLRQCHTRTEVKFLVRLLLRNLRVGIAHETILASIASLPVPSASPVVSPRVKAPVESSLEVLKRAFNRRPSWAHLLDSLAPDGSLQHTSLSSCHIEPFIPVTPMAAKAAAHLEEVLTRFAGKKVCCDWKYDGERAQVHLTVADGGKVSGRLFSRNLEDITPKFPEVVGALAAAARVPLTSVILDGEVVAVDVATGAMQPFQILASRSRKGSGRACGEGVAVQFIPFDLLQLNGRVTADEPLAVRRALLKPLFEATPRVGALSSVVLTLSDKSSLMALLVEAGADSEGLMVKDASSTYEAGKRSLKWLKLKKDYVEGLGDSFDLLPVGAWYGYGKRKGLFASFLLASRDDATGQFETIGRVGTGFTDKELARITETQRGTRVCLMQPPEVRASPSEKPDIWFVPTKSEVWEVAAANISRSPAYVAAEHLLPSPSPGSSTHADALGLSLRFPRFKRVRTDKTATLVTTSQQVADMYTQALAGKLAAPANTLVRVPAETE